MTLITSKRHRGAHDAGPSGWFVAPALVFFVIFAVVPLVGVIALSLASWNGIGAITWAGFANWAKVLVDPVTGNALVVTAKIMVFSYIVQAPISILLGAFVAGKQRYRALLAVFYFIPLLLSSAAVAIAFKALLDPNFGLGAGLGIPALAQDWLGNPDLVLFVVIFVIAWQFVPFHTLIYQGAVRQIPASMYEAARLDGAGTIAQFFHITLPQLKYTIITSSTLMVVGSLTYFDLIFILTAGGPGYSTRLLPLHMYLTGFRSNDMGAAAALGVILVVIGLLLALMLQRLGGKDRSANQTEGA
ncbi:sugar ABC transporter permease [Mycetocola lacteus]|uniref:Sugar ABC transporter permease n=1 Tax=Mycetocola lacteus TaxID=76637 RepID=A0A3L7AHS6_9MICO|nr:MULTISPECIES: sugar ABC transporter permease [Mycetocola]MCS4276713.1 raffinose/stachyose/melibiose transport system permease protein [Mycetocola sp. BIGb0189]RLP79757.1 sugar ABC transporter permease [Mycetocola lacteus]